MSRSEAVIAQIKRTLWILAGATVVLFVAVVLMTAYTLHNASQNHDALCSVRNDLQARVEQTRSFLNGDNRIPGVPASVLRVSIKNQKSTVQALNGLDC